MGEQTFDEFRLSIIGTRKGKQGKVRNSFGIYDVYKHIRKHHWYNIGRPVTEHEFYSIIRMVNQLLADEIALGQSVKFPYRMGSLDLRKSEREASFKDGKLKINYPQDWGSTLRLWHEDVEARKNKIILRMEEPYVYSVKYNKYGANYENKCFYGFDTNTFIKRALKENIKSGKTDTIW